MRVWLTTLLRRSERYTHVDMVFLAKGGSWLSAGQAVNMLLGFVMSIAFANLLPKEAFGTYKFILSAVALIGVFSFLDIGTAVTQAVARGFGNALRQGFRANLKWSFGVSLGGFALGIYYYLQGNALLSFSFFVAGVLVPLTASASLYGAYVLGKKDFKRSTLYGLVRNIVPAAALIGTLFLTESLWIIIGVYFVSAVLVSFVLYRATLRAYRNGNIKEDPGLVSYAGHLGIMGAIGLLADNLDKILVFHYLGAAPLAIYAFAVAPVEQLQGGKKILNALILTRLSERPFTELQKSAPYRTAMLAVYAAVLGGVYVLLVPYFYAFFYPQYLDSVFYSQIYALTLFGIIGSVLDANLVAHKKKKELYAHRIAVPIIKIFMFFILIPLFGLLGLVLTQVLTRFCTNFLTYYFVRHPFKSTPTVG